MILTAFLLSLTVTTHVLCVQRRDKMIATGNTTRPTPTNSAWMENNFYNSLPPMGVPQTSNAMTDRKGDPLKITDDERPQNDGRTRQRKGESHRSSQETVSSGCCLYYTDPLQCWARLQSRGLIWLRLAREYNSSFDYDFLDTCRYTTNAFRCTVPLSRHLAKILHTLTFYDLRYQMKIADRGPYGLHLDFLMNLNDVVNLMDLFSAESALTFQQQVWDFEESIYNSLKTEVYGLPRVPYDHRDLRPTFYTFFACICNQLDMLDPNGELQWISILKCCRPLTSLDDYLNDVHTRRVAGMPNAIHTRPTTAPRACGKRSARDSRSPPLARDAKPLDVGHIYTEANSAAEYPRISHPHHCMSPLHLHDPCHQYLMVLLEEYLATVADHLWYHNHNQNLKGMNR